MPSNIVIDTEPPSYSPVYNRINFCADETGFLPTSKTNYKYIYTLYYDNGLVSGSQKFFVPYFPDITNTQYGILDVSRYLDSFVQERIPNPSIPISETGVYIAPDTCIVEYYVEILSGWDDVNGDFEEDPDGVGPVTSSTLYAWCASFEHHDWIYQMNLGSPFNTWICNVTNGTSGKFLTDQPQTARYSEIAQLGWTSFMSDTLTDIDEVEVVTYDGLDGSGSVIGTFIVTNALAQSAIEERVMRFASAPGSLNLIDNAQITTGAQPIVTSSALSYTIQLQNSVGTAASEILTFNISTQCRYETHRIHFENKLGNFDTYNFTARSQGNTKITRKSYTKERYQVDGTGLLYTHAVNGKSDYLVKYQDGIKLKSGYLTDEENEWLKQLKTSPQVYLEFTDGAGNQDLKQVYVKDNSWIQNQTSVEKLFQIEVDIDLSHLNIRQRK